MKILGIRNAPQQLRYAILGLQNGIYTLLNASTENIIRKPATVAETSAHLKWIKDELHRVIRQNPDIELIALKVPEFAGSKTISARNGDYLDAITLLVANESDIPISTKLYSQMGTKRSSVLTHSEQRVGKTNNAWNEQIADAVGAAWSASR